MNYLYFELNHNKVTCVRHFKKFFLEMLLFCHQIFSSTSPALEQADIPPHRTNQQKRQAIIAACL